MSVINLRHNHIGLFLHISGILLVRISHVSLFYFYRLHVHVWKDYSVFYLL